MHNTVYYSYMNRLDSILGGLEVAVFFISTLETADGHHGKQKVAPPKYTQFHFYQGEHTIYDPITFILFDTRKLKFNNTK